MCTKVSPGAYKGKERRTIYVERRLISNTSLATPYMDNLCTGNTHCEVAHVRVVRSRLYVRAYV